MITQRAVLFGFVGFCFYLIAIVNALPPFYYSLTWLTAGILVSCFGVALLSLFALQCEWSVPGSIATEWLGHDATKVLSGSARTQSEPDLDGAAGAPGIEIDIANAGTLNKTDIVLEVSLRETQRDQEVIRRFLIEALPSRGHLRTRLPLHDLPRGRYRVEEMRLIGSDVLGLFRLRKRVPAKTIVTNANAEPGGKDSEDTDAVREIVIGPAMVATPEIRSLLQLGGVGGGLDTTTTLGQGDEVRGTRPYNAGDDLRFVHWKTTARRGELVVREFHRTARKQCIVVWDGAADGTVPSVTNNMAASSAQSLFAHSCLLNSISRGVNRLARRRPTRHAGHSVQTSVEFGLRVTASLCRTIIDSGQPCALLRLDGNPLFISAAERGGNSSTLSRVSEALADAAANRTTSLTQALASWTRDMPSGSGLYIVTASPSPDLTAAAQSLRAQRSNVAVCVIDLAKLASIVSPQNINPQPAQSTSDGLDVRSIEATKSVTALRATGIVTVTTPSREAHEEKVLLDNSLSLAERRADLEIAAIRTALRELLQNSSHTSPLGGLTNASRYDGDKVVG